MNVRAIINRAILDNAMAKGPEVLYIGLASKNPARIHDVRTRDCAIQVRFLSTGVWVQLESGDRIQAGDWIIYNETTR